MKQVKLESLIYRTMELLELHGWDMQETVKTTYGFYVVSKRVTDSILDDTTIRVCCGYHEYVGLKSVTIEGDMDLATDVGETIKDLQRVFKDFNRSYN